MKTSHTTMEETVALIHRAQAGDSEAYGLLVSRFQDMAYGYAYAILSDFHLAQDAAQEAFIEAYQCLPTLHEPLAFPAWLKRIVYKHCDRLIRGKRLSTAPLETATETPSPTPGPSEVAEQHELALQVQDAIRELPVPQRTVTTLFYINGYSHQEIADFLEVPAATVKSRLHASRNRLRERMIDMVQDELKANALPDDFAKEIVERAYELKCKGKIDESEQMLRELLEKLPKHPQALRELNRTLMHGRVYGQSRWDLLPELAEHARTILETSDDEFIRDQLAVTLLAIPAMPEAIEFLEGWIAKSGPNMARVGMLAWAKGCVADYDAAGAGWQEVLALSQDAEPDDVLFGIPYTARNLVDCFAEAGHLPRAQRVAREAWDRCRGLTTTTEEIEKRCHYVPWFPADPWMGLFNQAGLDPRELVDVLLSWLSPEDTPRALSIRMWVEDPQVVMAEWLAWARERIAAGDYTPLGTHRITILGGLRRPGLWQIRDELAHAMLDLLNDLDSEDAGRVRTQWGWDIDDPWGAILAKDWPAAEKLARRKIEECGMQAGGSMAIIVAAAQGAPTPPDIVQAVEEGGIESVDSYGMFGWYMVAREAAAAGDEEKAFDALRKALPYWTNPPYASTAMWENDAYWGELRDDSRFKEAFEERRRRIGPIYGLLHYFPGW